MLSLAGLTLAFGIRAYQLPDLSHRHVVGNTRICLKIFFRLDIRLYSFFDIIESIFADILKQYFRSDLGQLRQTLQALPVASGERSQLIGYFFVLAVHDCS